MSDTEVMEALEKLHAEWRDKGYPYATTTGEGWTMTCPSCSIAIGDGQISLVDALNRAIRHHHVCQSSPAGG